MAVTQDSTSITTGSVSSAIDPTIRTNGSSSSNGSSPGKSEISSTPRLDSGCTPSDLTNRPPEPSQAGSSGSSCAVNVERVKSAKITFEVAKTKLKEVPADSEAIDLLDQVCCVLKEELGDLNIETCDALYYYGSALLDNYQTGSDLMGIKANAAIHLYPTEAEGSADAKPGTSSATPVHKNGGSTIQAGINQLPEKEGPNGDGDESASEESDLESLPGGGPLEGTKESIADEEDDDMEDETAETFDYPEASTSENGGRRSLGSGKTKSDSEGDAIAELRYAWEILEISRVGYEKRLREGASHSEKLRLSDIHYKLSMCAAENGDQNVAVVEAERSLKVCQECCGPTDRDLAEAYFNLGSVYSMYSLLSEAADNMKKAVAILEARKVQVTLELQSLQTGSEDALTNLAKRKPLEKQMAELNELIPDLMRRIQDTYEDMRLGSDEAKRLLDNWLRGVSDKCHSDAGVPVNNPPPINDISHLVRRIPPKRTSGADEEEPAKRVRVSDDAPSEFSGKELVEGKTDDDVETVSEPRI